MRTDRQLTVSRGGGVAPSMQTLPPSKGRPPSPSKGRPPPSMNRQTPVKTLPSPILRVRSVKMLHMVALAIFTVLFIFRSTGREATPIQSPTR